jgi:type I restriction enzyme R subunit
LVSPDKAAVQVKYDAEFFSDVAKAARKLTPAAHDPSTAAKQAVKQFFSEGLAAGEVVDVLAIAEKDRPEISVLSDEFLDGLGGNVRNPDLQVMLLRKLLDDEIRAQRRTSSMQAKLFSDELDAILGRYRLRQVHSAEIVAALVELAKKMRQAKHRHEALGLTREEAAFYDALAGSAEDWQADPQLAEIAREIVRAVKKDLSVDWTTHEAREAAVRRNVRRLLRRKKYEGVLGAAAAALMASGGSGNADGRRPLDRATELILQQARALYQYWPDVELV